MSLSPADLSLAGFASIHANSTKYEGFVTRDLLAQLVDLSASDCIADVFTQDPAEVYKEICDEFASIHERARMVNAVLTFFNNSPEAAERFASWKMEWEALKIFVERQEMEDLLGDRSLTIATGLATVFAVDHAKTWPMLLNLQLSPTVLKAVVRTTVDVVDDLFEDEAIKAHQVAVWKKRLELVDLF